MSQSDLSAALPLIILAATGLFILLWDAFEKTPSRIPLYLTILGAGTAAVFAAMNMQGISTVAFGGLFFNSAYSNFFTIIFCAATILTALLAEKYLKEEEVLIGEFCALILFAATGMVMMASGAFHAGHPDVAEIETAYHTLTPLLGVGAASVFLISLMASGISSSAVGTMAGQVIMQGFVGFRIPVWLRRLVTMIPAFVVVGLGMNATDSLFWSQIVLSFALPIPMIALVILSRRADIMGKFANGPMIQIIALVATIVVLALNTVLLLQSFGVNIPSLPSS